MTQVNITNDMTDLSKLRSGQFTMHLAPASLRHVLESCVLSVQPSLTRPADVELLCDGDVPDQVRARRAAAGKGPPHADTLP